MRLTGAHIEAARDMKMRGLPDQTIADRIGCAKKTVQFALHPERREVHRLKVRDHRLAKRNPHLLGNDEPRLEIPESTRRQWFERAKAYAQRMASGDATAIIHNDPLPGWSALERR
jgi:hypothetical protein